MNIESSKQQNIYITQTVNTWSKAKLHVKLRTVFRESIILYAANKMSPMLFSNVISG